MSDGGDIRDEAERLVSATLAAASFALRGTRAFSTYGNAGSRTADGEPAPPTAEWCFCPVCRGVAAVRNVVLALRRPAVRRMIAQLQTRTVLVLKMLRRLYDRPPSDW